MAEQGEDDPDVSVIVAVKNGGPTLERCLQSIVTQMGCTTEIVVIDALSDDETPSVVAAFGSAITVSIRESDAGIYEAWNKGIARSRGEWCSFLGADDFFTTPESLNHLLRFARSSTPKPVHVFGRVRLMADSGPVVLAAGSADTAERLRRGQMVPHPGSLHLRSELLAVGGFDAGFRIAGDLDLLLRLVERGRSVGSEQIVVDMADGGMSTAWKFNRLRHAERLRVLRRHRGFFGALVWTVRPFVLERIERALLAALRHLAGAEMASRVVRWFRGRLAEGPSPSP